MNNSDFSLADRKVLADMLKDSYDCLRRSTKDVYRRAKHQLIQDCLLQEVTKAGALKLLDRIKVVETDLDTLKAELASRGFRYNDNGDLETVNAHSPVNATVRKAVSIAIGSEDSIDADFDGAMLAIMTATTLEDAKQIIRDLPKF